MQTYITMHFKDPLGYLKIFKTILLGILGWVDDVLLLKILNQEYK